MSLPTIVRPVRPVSLPGGSVVHVRGLTLGQLRRIDTEAEAEADPAQRAVETTVRVAAAALAHADGSPVYADPGTGAFREVAELFTPDQFDAVFKAAVGRDKDAAKN